MSKQAAPALEWESDRHWQPGHEWKLQRRVLVILHHKGHAVSLAQGMCRGLLSFQANWNESPVSKSFSSSSTRTTLHIRLLWFKWHPFYHNDIEPTWKMFQDTKSFKFDIWNGVLFQNWNFPITDDIFVLWSLLSFILIILHRPVFVTHWRPVIKWCSEFSHWDIRKKCLLDSFCSFFFLFFLHKFYKILLQNRR